jgi:hypothetical protein
MGIEDGRFFLSTGGFISGNTKYGALFTRPATGRPPVDLVSPPFFGIRSLTPSPP